MSAKKSQFARVDRRTRGLGGNLSTGARWLILAAGVVCISSSLAGCPGFNPQDDAARETPAPEPPKKPLLAITPARGSVLGGTRVTISSLSDEVPSFVGGSEVILGGFLASNIELVDDKTIRATIPAQSAGRVDVTVRTHENGAATESAAFEYVAVADADAEICAQIEQIYPGAPRVVSAVATSNTSVRVTFSEPVRSGVTDNSNYSVIIPDGGILMLDREHPPVPRADLTVVELTTLSQTDAMYQLTVTGIRDLVGNSIAAPDMLVDPAVTTFFGIAPAHVDAHTDTDGDGFADWFEMLGWEITIELADGTRVQSYVTSDPYNPDTDGDGMDDGEENAHSLDPRTDDTDADLVPDYDELYLWRSNPRDQDSDDDGFADHTELHFQTSLILADTDGDQLDDRDELLNRGRNPRIADLPIPVVTVGEMNLELDQRYTYSDQFGREQQFQESYNDTLQRDSSSSISNTQSMTARAHIENKLTIGGGAEWGKGDLGPVSKFHVSASNELSVGFGWEGTLASTQQTSRSASRTYNEAVSRVSQISSTSSVTRETVGARLSSAITLSAGSDIAFQVSELEISVLQQDPRDRSRLIPIATLEPSEPDAVYSVGPLMPEIGPLIFENSEIFPSMVESLMKDARGLAFEVANFSITDELDRNFAFSSQEVIERTASITIDFGNGESENYRIATAGQFDMRGNPQGIGMADALRAAGLVPWPGEDPELGSVSAPNDKRPKPVDPEIVGSFGMRTLPSTDDDGNPINVRVITRVRGVQDDFDAQTVEPDKPHDGGFWITFVTLRDPSESGAGPALRGAGNFDEIRLHAGESYIMAFVKDKDRDQLTSLEEFFSGSSDSLSDTDQDGLGDFLEVRGQWNDAGLGAWLVYTDKKPGGYRAYAAPYMADSDEDGLTDGAEYALCRYRYAEDGSIPAGAYATETTDGGVSSWDVAPEDLPDAFAPADGLPRGWHTQVNAETGAPARFPRNHAALDPRKADTDEDGITDADEVNGYYVELFDDQITDDITRRVFVYSDPLNADTDRDGLLDGMESLFGTNPVGTDSGTVFDDDLDGLPNRVEETGWTITINGVERQVFSNSSDPDSDNDNIPDYVEWLAKTNPWYDCDPADKPCFDVHPDPDVTAPGYDTDDDGLSDYDEWDGVVLPQDQEKLAFCEQVPNCAGYLANAVAYMTDPREADTDGDGLDDGAEIAGWTVCLNREPAGYPVHSDPLDPDTDVDGWPDGDEFTYGSDPRKADTDGDGTYDPVEVTRVASDGSTRDPLTRDQRITITFDWFSIIQDGRPGGSGTCLPSWPTRMSFEFGAWWVDQALADAWVTSDGFFDGESDYDLCPECWDGGSCSSSSDCAGWCQVGGSFVSVWEGSELWLPGYVEAASKSFIARHDSAFVPYGRVRLTENLEQWKYIWYPFDSATPMTIPVETPLQMLNQTTGPDFDIDGDDVELDLSGRIMVD